MTNPSSSYIVSLTSNPSGDSDEKGPKRASIRLLQFSATTSLPQSPALAKVSEKKRAAEALSAEELRSWTRGLPAVGDLELAENRLSTIWAEAAHNARSAARSFVLGGLSEKDIDFEAHRILNNCYERAKEILQRNRKLRDSVVDHLVEKNMQSNQEGILPVG